jgi:ion channel-forming bestrophin family protein
MFSNVQMGHWWRAMLTVRGSVLPTVWRRSLICGLFGVGISVAYVSGVEALHKPALGNIVPGIVLGLLLVFRTNTAYDRFWEGRRSWGAIVNASRNLARQMLVTIPAGDESEQYEKEAAIRLVAAFATTTKQLLRHETLFWEEMEGLLSSRQLEILQRANHPPLEVSVWIDDYLQEQRSKRRIDSHQLVTMMQLLNQLVDNLGACERILKTPMPIAYSIHLKQLLMIYCLGLPFAMVKDLGYLTGPVIGLVSFTLLGIEAIGLEIENPFGKDPNDLPLDGICANLRRNVEDLIRLGPDCGRQAVDRD